MGRSLFLRIFEKVVARDSYFVQRRDDMDRLGLSALQKITAVFRTLAYGCPADATDEYIKIGEPTPIESLKRFYHAIMEEFTGEYLRSPKATDVARLLRIGKDRGFSGMLGSLDCIHWKRKNCPTTSAGQYADERDVDASVEDHIEALTPEIEMMLDENTRFQQFLARHREHRDKDIHITL
ncbi:hypothetical protein Ddye_000513 [Dipteronia dyeriana]|uniref:Uncharacterized protein n=1 Tax=Dipteronia dyeriana TaxID=168575 RepID=A0AAD9XLV4_9ROSI|nr:hypothetical protein Ddye_000513 [Dipteronia dyeriana]